MSSKFDTLLRACAHPGLYLRNGFRTLGLPVPAELRVIARRTDELRLHMELGGAPDEWAFAPKPAPDHDAVRAASRALQEPVQRLLDEFFWFWPLTYPASSDDEALGHLARCDTATATALWSEAAGEGHPVAWHNLAVYQHLLALEWEQAEEADRALLNRVHAEASDYWRHVEGDDALWQLVEARVAVMNDPQLPEAAATKLREALPEVLARIHAENAVRYVATGDEETARLHMGLARAHLPAERLAGVLETALQPAVGRLEALAALARRPTGVIEPLCAVLKAAAPDLALLAAVDGPDGAPHLHGHQTRLLADAVLDGLVAYQRASGDDASCLPLLFHLLDVATAPELVQRVEEAFGVMWSNALAAALTAAGEPFPPEHVVTLELINAVVIPGVSALGLSGAAAEATNARLAGWLKTVAEDALRLSPAHLGWALHTLDQALALPMDVANAQALRRIRAEWLAETPTPGMEPLELTAGETRLRIDASGVSLNERLVSVADLTGLRHAWVGFTAATPTEIGWCSAEESFVLSADFFAELPDGANDGAAMRAVLAAFHGFLVPALVARTVAAVRAGAVLSVGTATLGADGSALAEGEPLTPYARLLLAYRDDLVILASKNQPATTVELDPQSSWNVVLLPHFVAALTPIPS